MLGDARKLLMIATEEEFNEEFNQAMRGLRTPRRLSTVMDALRIWRDSRS